MSALPAGPRLAIGLALTAVGVALAAFGAAGALHAGASMQVVALPAGLAFVFGGGLVLVPDRLAALRLTLGALMVSSLALVFDWVAFAPGERQFTGSLAAGGAALSSPVGETAGRVFFGLFALAFDIAAIGLWLRLIRGPRSQ
ncbi:MAG TPA: hypothetical protein VE325_12505 [Burkholderiales bacterium]|nr:hypothetical protein [Burkholderiales bacterium]